VISLAFRIKQPRTCTGEKERRKDERGEVLPTIGGLGGGAPGYHG